MCEKGFCLLFDPDTILLLNVSKDTAEHNESSHLKPNLTLLDLLQSSFKLNLDHSLKCGLELKK